MARVSRSGFQGTRASRFESPSARRFWLLGNRSSSQSRRLPALRVVLSVVEGEEFALCVIKLVLEIKVQVPTLIRYCCMLVNVGRCKICMIRFGVGAVRVCRVFLRRGEFSNSYFECLRKFRVFSLRYWSLMYARSARFLLVLCCVGQSGQVHICANAF